jgi:hypothetical protein
MQSQAPRGSSQYARDDWERAAAETAEVLARRVDVVYQRVFVDGDVLATEGCADARHCGEPPESAGLVTLGDKRLPRMVSLRCIT